MRVPSRYFATNFRVRKQVKEQIRNAAERERARLRRVEFNFGRKPSHILLLLGVMVVVGGLLIKGPSKPSGSSANPALSTAERETTTLRAALEVFRIECGRYPTAEEGLYALVHNPGSFGWQGPYVNMIHPDPWMEAYVYESSNGVVRLSSKGPDRLAGTADDILPSDAGVKAMLKH
jgi:general secretion pathway protein G